MVTSGGTKEYIDDVRVLTNISTGKLGQMIAQEFIKDSSDMLFQEITETSSMKIVAATPKYKIYYVCPQGAAVPSGNFGSLEFIKITDVNSLKTAMEKLVPEMDVVIHSMAVSDFGFKSCNTKLKSSDPQAFIDSLRDRITMNPKILPMIKQWNPNCILIGFKFEVGSTHEERQILAKKQIDTCGCDAVLTNDKKEMQEKSTHVARMYFPDNTWTDADGKEEIAKMIKTFIKSKLNVHI